MTLRPPIIGQWKSSRLPQQTHRVQHIVFERQQAGRVRGRSQLRRSCSFCTPDTIIPQSFMSGCTGLGRPPRPKETKALLFEKSRRYLPSQLISSAAESIQGKHCCYKDPSVGPLAGQTALHCPRRGPRSTQGLR